MTFWSHEIKRRLSLGRKVMTNLDSILQSRGITLPTKVRLVKAMVFPVVMYGCECWTIKKAEHQRIVAFKSLSRIWLFATPLTAARHAPLSSTIYWSLLKFMSIEWVMLCNHPLLPPSPFAFNLSQHQGIFQWVWWSKNWSFSFSISPSN